MQLSGCRGRPDSTLVRKASASPINNTNGRYVRIHAGRRHNLRLRRTPKSSRKCPLLPEPLHLPSLDKPPEDESGPT